MLEVKFDTQLLIEGENLSEDEIAAYITCLLYTSFAVSSLNIQTTLQFLTQEKTE